MCKNASKKMETQVQQNIFPNLFNIRSGVIFERLRRVLFPIAVALRTLSLRDIAIMRNNK